MLLEARLLATVSRLAGPVRGAGVVLISLFGAFSTGSALGWVLFAFVAVTAVADFRLPRVALPVAFVRVVVLSVVLGGEGQWVLTVLTTTLITWQWQWPLRVTVPATAALLAVQVAVAGPGVLVRAVLESVLARVAYELLRRSSRRVDVVRERAAEQSRAAAIALDRGRREREYLALLHDTAAATFLMAAHGGDPVAVAAQARRDLVVLAERGEAEGTVDLGAALAAVARDSGVAVRVSAEVVPVPAGVALAFVRAARELLVNVERHAGTREAELTVSRGGAAVDADGLVRGGAGVVGADGGGGLVRGGVAVVGADGGGGLVRGGVAAVGADGGGGLVRGGVAAVGADGRGGLVRCGAGAGNADGGRGFVPGGATAVIRDSGQGFVPGDVPEHRRGLRGSVVDRLRAVGGAAVIDSAPGSGTTARLVWPHD